MSSNGFQNPGCPSATGHVAKDSGEKRVSFRWAAYCGSSASPQKEKDQQDRQRHTDQPQQDPADPAFFGRQF